MSIWCLFCWVQSKRFNLFLNPHYTYFKKKTKSILYFFFQKNTKTDKFYWEIVLCIRKIIIVGVGVFGPSLGPVRQSQVALLIIVFFIVLELLGSPFKETTERHKILAKLELSSLLVLFLTLWSGLMIFSSAELGDTGTVHFMTVCVVLMTAIMMLWLVSQLVRECAHEHNVSPAAAKAKMIVMKKKASIFFQSRRPSEGKQNDVEMTPRVFVWSEPNNPMFGKEKENRISTK